MEPAPVTPDDPPAMTRRELLAGAAGGAVALGGVATLSRAAALAPPPPGGSLRERADRKGLFCGSCLDVTQLDTAPLLAALREDCNILVPENGFNWTRTQAGPNAPLHFEQAEAVYAFARQTGVPMRGHNLVWHGTTPGWVDRLVPGLSTAAVETLMTDHIRRSIAVWGGRLIHQEVVNEPIDSLGLSPFAFSRRLGERYIDVAFHTARAHDPHALLFLNQDLVEQDWSECEKRRRNLLGLIERLLKRGVPVDALGIEGHLTLEQPFSERIYRDFLHEVSGMGLKLLVSEFDVLDLGVAGSVARRDAAVAALGKAFLDVSFDNPACLGMLDWSHGDRDNWLRKTPSKQRGDGQPLRPSPLDDAYRRKPLWNAIAAAYDGAPAGRRLPRA